MTFSGDLNRFAAKLEQRRRDLFIGVATETLRSIQEGSPLTGAPGQPVGQYGPGYHEGAVGGTLRASWQLWFEGPMVAFVATNLVYAPVIEELVGKYGPIRIRSTVGGGHSVKLTRAGFQRIVESVAQEVTRGEP
jgi:hypothetical protein